MSADQIIKPTDTPKPVPNPPLSKKGFQPRDYSEVHLLAHTFVSSEMTPFDSISKAIVAMEHGLSLGMSISQALCSIAVINGRPGIYGDAAIALCRSTGQLKYHKETVTGSIKDGDLTATCKIVRIQKLANDEWAEHEYEHTFSMDDAKAAKLWMKKGRNGSDTPWVTYPKRMLMMRARGFALRDAFPDVLKGIGIAEELHDYPAEAASDTPRTYDPKASRVDGLADRIAGDSKPATNQDEEPIDTSAKAIDDDDPHRGHSTNDEMTGPDPVDQDGDAEPFDPSDLDLPDP